VSEILRKTIEEGAFINAHEDATLLAQHIQITSRNLRCNYCETTWGDGNWTIDLTMFHLDFCPLKGRRDVVLAISSHLGSLINLTERELGYSLGTHFVHNRLVRISNDTRQISFVSFLCDPRVSRVRTELECQRDCFPEQWAALVDEMEKNGIAQVPLGINF
jgi:hypothetical protein